MLREQPNQDPNPTHQTPTNARLKEIATDRLREFYDYGALRQALGGSAARFPAFTDIVRAGLHAETQSGQAAADRPTRRPQESARGKHWRRWALMIQRSAFRNSHMVAVGLSPQGLAAGVMYPIQHVSCV